MSIKIGHATVDEKGTWSGGTAGDNTKKEVCVRTWYNRPWNVILRCKDSKMAEKIAVAMERACANNNIGYDQYQRNTLLTQARKVNYNPAKVTVKCETDCSALVSLCCMYAGIEESALYKYGNSSTTSVLRSRLLATGKFEALTASKYLTSGAYLKRGDILLYEGHHTAVALDDGPKTTSASSNTNTSKTYTVKKGDTLSAIAEKYGTTINAIVNANKSKYPTITASYIVVGWKLTIPSANTKATLKAGQKLTLVNVSLYATANTSAASKKVTGTYYLWDAKVSNGRVRITNSASNVGKASQITGWIKKSSI